LGTPWIPAKDVQRFLVETIGIAPSSVSVEYVRKEALWKVRPASGYRTSAAAISEYGTEDVDAFTLVEQALNMRSPTVRRRIPGGPGESDTYVVDQEATLLAREKQAELKARFGDWAFEDPERSERLVCHYNEHFNNLRLREFDGEHLTFPRMSSAITMRPHQKHAIWRNMSSGNTLLAHVVGAGKTFTMVSAGMEMKRTGLAQKPLYVVPNHMLEQFSREFLVLYPDANLLVATKQDLAKARRQLLKARMATGDWDGIVMTHSSFEKIAMSPGFQARFLADQLAEYEELLASVEDRSLSRNITKRIEKLKAGRKAKLKEMTGSGAKDGGLFFDELGIDQVFIDEAHMYKNLETPTKMDRVAGIQTGGSNRAFDLLMKARYLQSRTPGRGLTFATGTPVSNSLGEMYTMMR
ncbi:MAG: DEAD/DEAH box helicase family protein, partial [bacterium]|nr:DEAD/DEAH box helicase family protein [bacterium]